MENKKPKYKYEIQTENASQGRLRGFTETSFPNFQEQVDHYLNDLGDETTGEDTIIIRKRLIK